MTPKPAGATPPSNSSFRPVRGARSRACREVGISSLRADRLDDEIVAVRIAYREADLRERAKRLGAVWRPAQKLWELSWLDAKRLGLADRIVTSPPEPEVSNSRHLPA